MKCQRCGRKFEAGNWLCASGEKHVVPSKTYLSADAPQQCGRNSEGPLPKTGRTLITNIPPPVFPEGWQPGADDEGLGGVVEFVNGRFETCDPEQQYWLDLRGGFCTEQEWGAAWLSPEELQELKLEAERLELAAERRRLEQLRQENKRLKSRAAKVLAAER